jgi:hypothetical protein
MKMQGAKNRTWVWVIAGLVCLLICALALANAGSFLVVDEPKRSDVILVLAGETFYRPKRGLELLSQGYGKRMILDVPTDSTLYKFTQIQLAEKYVQDLPEAASVSICPIEGLSTKTESRDVSKCLKREDAKSVLIVTADFHTRRSLSVYRHELPEYTYSAASAPNDTQFGVRWWTHRQWAKVFVDEWLRLIWWEGVDRWR